MIKIRVLFSNTEDEIDTYFDHTVISFKQQLQKHYLFDDLNFHLIFSGKILDNAETLAKSGIKDGCKLRIYFRQKPKSYITIVGGGFKQYLTKIDGEMIVGELRTNIADKTGLQLEHLKLIFSGKVLVDEMTLNFYNITNGSLIYVASMKSDINRKVRPSMLLNQLYQLVSSLVSNPNQNRAVLMSEISELIENPVLQSYARIDRNAHKLMDEALRVLESVAATPVTNYEIIARLNDLALMQYEAYPEGINSLQETMISDNEDDDYIFDDFYRILLDYTKAERPCDEPLPMRWPFDDGSPAIELPPSYLPLREMFASQIKSLKELGFKDEFTILQVLNETAGNVPKAARILFGMDDCLID